MIHWTNTVGGISGEKSSSNPEDKQLIYAPLLQQVSDLIKIHSKQKGNMERTFVVEKITAFSHSFSVYLNEIAVSIQSKNSTLAEFLQKLPDEKDQFETLLAFLKSQSIIVTSEDETLVKILKDDQGKDTKNIISKKEASILSMRRQIHDLEIEEKVKEADLDENTKSFKHCMQRKELERARGYKRKMDLLSKIIVRNVNMRFKLEELLSHLDNPMVEIVGNMFKEATQILKEQRLSGFSLDDVEKTMDALQDEFEEANLASELASKPIVQNSAEDEELLSAEYDALMGEEPPHVQQHQQGVDMNKGHEQSSVDIGSTLPQVPSTDPSVVRPPLNASTNTSTSSIPSANSSQEKQKVAVPL